MRIALEEATLHDIFRELAGRYPDGLVIICSRPTEGEEVERGWHDEDVVLAYHRLVASIGLTKAAITLLEEKVKTYFQDRDEDDDDEDEAA